MRTKSSLLGSKCDCKVTIELSIDKSYLQKFEKERQNEDWKTIKTFLDSFGFESKFVHVSVLAPQPYETSQEPDNKIGTMLACRDKRVDVARPATTRSVGRRHK